MIFQTQYNRDKFPRKGEINNLPSLTIPDHAMSITEIIRRYASGLPLAGQRIPMYEGEDDILNGIDIRTLDLSERMDLIEKVSKELFELKTKTNEQPNQQPATPQPEKPAEPAPVPPTQPIQS